MSRFGFLVILRDSGIAAYDLCRDIAAVAQSGDEVILLDDSGPGVAFHTSQVAARFGAMEGWPDGVEVRLTSTGARGLGDEGTAVALALDQARTEHLIVLPGRARLQADGFRAARSLAQGVDLVVAAVASPDPIPPQTPSSHLGRLIFRRSLAEGLLCVQGEAGGGTLPLVVGLQSRAQSPALSDTLMSRLPPLAEINPDYLSVWEGIYRDTPQTALDLLPEQITQAGVGARLVLAAGLARLGVTSHPSVGRVRVADPPPVGRAKIKIALEGPHAHRTPLAYGALSDLWENDAEIITDPNKANLIVYAHLRDLDAMRPEVAGALGKRPDIPVALLSEEPFWDTLFSPDPLAQVVTVQAAHYGFLRVYQCNHHTSPVFDFERIPYFLLTDPAYAMRYAAMFARNAKLSPQDWETAFQTRAQGTVFMAERRPEPFHDLTHPGGEIVGLCAWRTRLAEAVQGDKVARLGASWGGDAPQRQMLDDWHADKLAQLDGQVQILSGLENTHQPTYLSEKLFDAFACGARPLFMGGPAHKVHGLGLPPEAWVNLWGYSSDAAASHVDALTWDKSFYRAYSGAQSVLAQLWGDAEVLTSERARLGRALRAELHMLADSGPA